MKSQIAGKFSQLFTNYIKYFKICLKCEFSLKIFKGGKFEGESQIYQFF